MNKQIAFGCQDIRICAAALLDGQLSPAEEQLVDEHLYACTKCSEFIGQLEEQDLQPPNLQIIQDDVYWSEMDAALHAELDAAEQKSVAKMSDQVSNKKWLWFYAAALLLSILWGSYEHQRVAELEYIVQAQQQTLEKLANQVDERNSKSVIYVPAKMEL